MKKIEVANFKRISGITLVALVVTIVVLLILAGVTIMYVMGENSIFNQASKAKLNTELAKIEEQASMIYTDKLLEKIQTSLNDKPTMQEVVVGLREEGYTIEQVAVSGNEVTGISLDKEAMSLGKEKSNTIQVTIEGNNEPYVYYVKVNGKYYRMHFNGGVITIDRTETDISGTGDTTTQTVTVSSGDENIATATVDNATNVVTVMAKNTIGTVTITVTYGNYTKVCNVRVCDITTELEINSVRARIATGYTRWLSATAKPDTASQEFEWTSSNTGVATVDNRGVITAKKKGTTMITVKTIDGSNFSKTCEVTIDDAVDIATLTDFQTKNTIARDENGNLITVPGDFKVLTSEGTKVTQGIVVQDREGNEFVWVPVDSVSTGTSKPADDIRLGRYTFDATNGTPKKEQDADNYDQTTLINHRGSEYEELSTNSDNIAAKSLGDFIAKTKANSGYYFGRYEASQGSDGKADSQFDKVAWVRIIQPNAATQAREMYDSSYIESDLINSYSWDTAIVFIQKYSENANYANKVAVNSSRLNTGKSGDKVCNIYDMASNCAEWSTEHCYSRPGVCRGGTAGDNKSTTRYRYNNPSSTVIDFLSFRPLFYIK